jgi:hypothetical protein
VRQIAILSELLFQCFIAFRNERRGLFYSATVCALSIFFLESTQVRSHKCSQNTLNECQENGLPRANRPQADVPRSVSHCSLNHVAGPSNI